MLEQGAAEGIDIGVWVLYLADFAQNAWDGVKALSGQIADVVVLDMLVGVLLQVHEPWVGVPEDGVTVARDHSALG